jgi:hypothetical protein
VELLRKAIEWQALLASGEAPNQVAIARREGLTRARVTQVMGLLRLAPEIHQHILSLPDRARRPVYHRAGAAAHRAEGKREGRDY